jgi:hypothetical protein
MMATSITESTSPIRAVDSCDRFAGLSSGESVRHVAQQTSFLRPSQVWLYLRLVPVARFGLRITSILAQSPHSNDLSQTGCHCRGYVDRGSDPSTTATWHR